jgi:aminoglycoside/choline kinase family phosphotransferase
MLMDQPPTAETPPCGPEWDASKRTAAGWNAMARLSAGRIEAFASTAAYLRAQGLSAPDVIALDPKVGMAILEDLGEDVFARGSSGPTTSGTSTSRRSRRRRGCTRASRRRCWRGYGVAWPLLDYDEVALKAGADLFVDWYPKLDPRMSMDQGAQAEWDALWAPVQTRGAAGASVFAHRDYHAENLLWLADREGPARVGLIDFQDAVRAHPSWDLHSLLQDARRDVSPELERAALDHYFEVRPGVDREAFMADYVALAALNEARILGIFARLIVRDGKPRYQQFLPRMWRQLERKPAGAGHGGTEGLVRPARRLLLSRGRLMAGPRRAMVLAAGSAPRMRPLTDDRSKALVEVGGRALIDHMLDRLAEAGVEQAVVNVH